MAKQFPPDPPREDPPAWPAPSGPRDVIVEVTCDGQTYRGKAVAVYDVSGNVIQLVGSGPLTKVVQP